MKGRQISLFSQSSKLSDFEKRSEHGAELRKGHRKLARPFSTRRALHLTLRSTRAQGPWSMLRPKHAREIQALIRQRARQNGVRLYQYANSGNHLHLLARAKTHGGFKRFLREISGLIARLVTGARKGSPKGKFWDALAYSRIVEWGRDFFNTRYYVIRNELEAEGLVAYKPRKGSRKRGPPIRG